jgi:hypothetical protein
MHVYYNHYTTYLVHAWCISLSSHAVFRVLHLWLQQQDMATVTAAAVAQEATQSHQH